MSRPTMRFVPVKTAEQQAALMLAGTRDGLIRRRTQLSNTIRGYAAEFGLTAAKGLDKIEPLLGRVAEAALPKLAKELFATYAREYARLKVEITKIEAKLMAWHKHNELSQRLEQVPGVGPIGASLAAMKVPDPHAFRCCRGFSAWLGMTPQDHSTAGKTRLGVITRAGDEALRRVLVVGATAVIQKVKQGKGQPSPWLVELLRRKPSKLAAIALANKNARIIWKLMVSGERYNPVRAVAAGNEGWRSRPAQAVTPCSPPSRTLRAAAGGGPRGPSLTAAALGVTGPRQVRTEKRPSGRTKKPTLKKLENVAPAAV